MTLDHKSFAEYGPLALVTTALYPILVHRPAVSLHASFPRFVAASQLRFTSLAVVSSREDFHLQECAHAGRTKKPTGVIRGSFLYETLDLVLERRVFAEIFVAVGVIQCFSRVATRK